MINNDDFNPIQEENTNGDEVHQPVENNEISDSHAVGETPGIPDSDPAIPIPDEIEDQEEIMESPTLSSADFTEDEQTPEIADTTEEIRIESNFRRKFRIGIRWATGVLILFGLGLLTGIFFLYRPALQEADNKSNLLKAELAESNKSILELEDQINELNTEISGLKPLEVKNDELLAEQQELNLHIAILDARIDVANAQLALKNEDKTGLQIILNQTSNTLKEIYQLLEPGNRDIVDDFEQRLQLVLEGLDNDLFAAQSDLDVLDFQLLQLQDSLFGD